MTPLQQLLNRYRSAAQTEREKGTYFEELICTYLRHEATYADLYSDVWLYADWAKEQGQDARDTGIDLVAKTRGTDEYHAIQCKFYAEDYRLQKSDIDSFFTASGQKPFTHRVIVSTTNHWTEHAEAALINQQPPVSKIDLDALEDSQIDWSRYQPGKAAVLKPKKTLRPHQQQALARVKSGLAVADRGKLIMACGSGKTFTSLKIAEELAGAGKRVLFLVPSLSLLSQTLSEWTQESATPLHCFAVCSDSEIGKKRKSNDDVVQTFAHELRYPATTNSPRLARELTKRHDGKHMSVVFSTYHSIEVISQAQREHGLADFDLIICDEAHRTTGATLVGEEESHFVKVHDGDFLRAAKRLYMTATPRIYGALARATAEKDDIALCDMEDESLYGKDLYVLTFSEAVTRELLTDYKVIVLAVDEQHVSSRLQDLLKDDNNTLRVDDAARIVGCWKALSKHDMTEGVEDDPAPMRRAVAFCQVIEAQKGRKTHKVSSKQIAGMFQAVVEAYQAQEDDHGTLVCEAQHVDGGMNASQKEEKLTWLKSEPADNTCHILSNVRCLSEGVDVPALDAVLFLTPRNSQVDVVQSVGRVMRNAPGKQRGYVILPVVIPTGMEPHEALNDNKTYKVVWEVLQALRSHDDRFDAMINKLDLNQQDPQKMEVIAITDQVQTRSRTDTTKKDQSAGAKGQFAIGSTPSGVRTPEQTGMQFSVGEVERALYAKVVQKCGNRNHWEEWANDIAKIAQTHIARITAIVGDPNNRREVAAFTAFADELRDDLNDSITNDEVIEMLAQHLITKPVFDALFEDYSFASNNPVSQAMQQVLDILQEHRLNKEVDTLERFYASVKLRAEGIDNATAKQKIVVELYDKFFKNAFPRMTERLGIVYTPVEVVDFIIHSVNDLLQQEFGQTLGSEGVHIIDPFTGTGTFVTRLLQSGLIKPEQLPHKYKHEIHANEIVLLAYYIAAINIEAVYHSLVGGDYEPFTGICLTDTFQMHEKDDMISDLMEDNSDRRKRQKELDIRVIMGNPPYSVGQNNANDNNQNIVYPHLNQRIRATYSERSSAINKNPLYDSYIRAIRWASDRINDSGIIGFVTNAGFLDANAMDGMRKCLTDEFSSIYVFHLRGNQRTSGELSHREGGKIFGSGSRAPIAVSMFVKNAKTTTPCQIYLHDIGDYMSREEKLDKISNFSSVTGITKSNRWQAISPDTHGDWVNQRDDHFYEYMSVGSKSGEKNHQLFASHSRGLESGRDAWCFNSSKSSITSNMKRMVEYYNHERIRFNESHQETQQINRYDKAVNFIDNNPHKISWTSSLIQGLSKNKHHTFEDKFLTPSIYRPFYKQWSYFNNSFNHRVGKMPFIFPYSSVRNRAILIKQRWTGTGQLALMVESVVELQTDGGAQCFPLYLYDEETSDKDDSQQEGLFTAATDGDPYQRQDALTDEGLAHFMAAYPGEDIGKEDIFYYVYGLLHSPDYRHRYANNLSKELPRIPCVKQAGDFWAFSKAGRALAELHLNYETVEMYPATVEGGNSDGDYRVEKMKYRKQGKQKDLTTLIYNDHITVTGIPLEAYDYVVNGKPALDWVVDRQCVKTDKASGIVNDANDWATETMHNPRYPLELFLRVITVSLETTNIVKSLPALDID